MTDIAKELDAFLEAETARGFAWGVSDCMLLTADWLSRFGPDPAKPWRGRYRSLRGAKRIIAQAGGFGDFCLTLMGQPSTYSDPKIGDVGLIAAINPEGWPHIAAISLGDGYWASRAQSGLLIGRATCFLNWSLKPCLRP